MIDIVLKTLGYSTHGQQCRSEITATLWKHTHTYIILITIIQLSLKGEKVNASHTRYRALGLELIPVYRQSARRSSTRR